MQSQTYCLKKLFIITVLCSTISGSIFSAQTEDELKEAAKTIELQNKDKIKLAREINDVLVDYCKKANYLLDKLGIDTSKAPEIKNIDNSDSLKKYLSVFIENYLEKDTEKFTNTSLNQKLFEATRTITDSTIGVRKITEFRLFAFTNNNQYVEQYDLKETKCIKDLALHICKIAWSVKNSSNENKNNVIYSFKTLFNLWNKTLDSIYDILQENGYTYISKKGEGEKIAQKIIQKAESNGGLIHAIKIDYDKNKELFEKALDDKKVSENVKKIFMNSYNKLFNENVKEFNYTVDEAIKMINSQIKAKKEKIEFIKAIDDSFQSINVFKWNSDALHPHTEKLKNFHDWALNEIKRTDIEDISDEESVSEAIGKWLTTK